MRASKAAVAFTYRGRGRHVCKCCAADIRAGQIVVMAATAPATTWALHEACAGLDMGGRTWRDFFDQWALEYYYRENPQERPAPNLGRVFSHSRRLQNVNDSRRAK